MVKNSFSLFETILAITVIALLVSGFLKFTYPKSDPSTSLESISNDFKQDSLTLSHQTTYFSLVQNGSQLIPNAGNEIIKQTYEDETFKFTQYTLSHPQTQVIESKVFE